MFKTGTLTLALALPFAVTQAFAADESKALETNFTYSQLGIGLGVINFDDSIIIAGDEYDGLAFLTLSGSVQIVENVVLGLSLNGAASEQFSGHASITPQEEQHDARDDHREKNPAVQH